MKKAKKELIKKNMYRYSMFMTCTLVAKILQPTFYKKEGDVYLKYWIPAYDAETLQFNPSSPVIYYRYISMSHKKIMITNNPFVMITENPFFKDCYIVSKYIYDTEIKQTNKFKDFCYFWKFVINNYIISLERIGE